MIQMDDTATECLNHEGDGYSMVIRQPGACSITVAAEHHFLDVHLGKSAATYEVAGFFEIGDKAPPATFVFLPANGKRVIKASRSGWSIQLAFEPRLFGVTGEDNHPRLGMHCHVEDDVMIGIAQLVSGIWHSELPEPTRGQLAAVAVLLIARAAHQLVHRPSVASGPSSASKRVQQVLDHIEQDLSASYTLGQLADIAGLSTYHFARLFRQSIGRSPHQYVVERRLAHAKRMLSLSDEPIVQIALDCGFGSQSHMTEVFKKILGTTPGAVRRSMMR